MINSNLILKMYVNDSMNIQNLIRELNINYNYIKFIHIFFLNLFNFQIISNFMLIIIKYFLLFYHHFHYLEYMYEFINQFYFKDLYLSLFIY